LDKIHRKEQEQEMDNVLLIRVIAGVGLAIVLTILIQRRRKRVQ